MLWPQLQQRQRTVDMHSGGFSGSIRRRQHWCQPKRTCIKGSVLANLGRVLVCGRSAYVFHSCPCSLMQRAHAVHVLCPTCVLVDGQCVFPLLERFIPLRLGSCSTACILHHSLYGMYMVYKPRQANKGRLNTWRS